VSMTAQQAGICVRIFQQGRLHRNAGSHQRLTSDHNRSSSCNSIPSHKLSSTRSNNTAVVNYPPDVCGEAPPLHVVVRFFSFRENPVPVSKWRAFISPIMCRHLLTTTDLRRPCNGLSLTQTIIDPLKQHQLLVVLLFCVFSCDRLAWGKRYSQRKRGE
jgi:hypothetical protein